MTARDQDFEELWAQAQTTGQPLPSLTEDDPFDPAELGLDPVIEEDRRMLRLYPTQEPTGTPPMDRMWRDADGLIRRLPYEPAAIEDFRRRRKHRAMVEAELLPRDMPDPQSVETPPAVDFFHRLDIPIRGSADIERLLADKLSAAIDAHRTGRPDAAAQAEHARDALYTLAKTDPQSAKRAAGMVKPQEEANPLESPLAKDLSGNTVSPRTAPPVPATAPDLAADDQGEDVPATGDEPPVEIVEWPDELPDEAWEASVFDDEDDEPDSDSREDVGTENEPAFSAFLEDIEQGAFDDDEAFELSPEERAFIDAYREAIADKSGGKPLESVDGETRARWREAAAGEAISAVFGAETDTGHPDLFLLDQENVRLAADQRTSPNVIGGDGEYAYVRAPEAVQAQLREHDTLADSRKYVALYDPATGQLTAWHRSPETGEGALTGLARVLSGGMVAGRGAKMASTGLRLARLGGRFARVTSRFAKIPSVVKANKKFGVLVDDIKNAQAIRAAGLPYTRPLTPIVRVGRISKKVRTFLKGKHIQLKDPNIRIVRKDLEHLTRDSKVTATTAAGLSKAVPLDKVKRLPEILARPSAVLWDKEKGGLLYVFNVARDPRKGKFVVEVNYNVHLRQGIRGKKSLKTINNVKSAGMVEKENLDDTNFYHVIDGNL